MARGGLALVGLLLLCSTVFTQVKAVEAETQKLGFAVAPLTTRGDLRAQVRWILQGVKAPIVHLRAFVVGTEQVEPARQALEEYFKKERRPLPALAVIAVGALPRPGALVLIETAFLSNKPNPNGLAFVSGQAGSEEKAVPLMLPLADKAMRDLAAVHRAVGIEAADVQRVTCFMTSLADLAEVERRVRGEFPQTPLSFVQLQRAPARAVVECESVARLRTPVNAPLKLIYADVLPKSPNFSHVALVGAKHVVFSGAHSASGSQTAEARRTFEALAHTLQGASASIKQVAMSSVYPTSQAAADLVRQTRFDFYDRANPPASTLLLFEGSSSTSLAFVVDVVAVKQ
jgi:enamine deaminase RidA (YjgF/YER057c/UK114 family)